MHIYKNPFSNKKFLSISFISVFLLISSSFSTYFAIKSHSKFTKDPIPFFRSIVSSSVCGIIDTLKISLSIYATVRLTPSTVIDPLKIIYFNKLKSALINYKKAETNYDAQARAAKIEKTFITEAKPGDVVIFGTANWVILDRKSDEKVLMMKEKVGKKKWHEG